VVEVQERRWGSKTNDELLSLAKGGFDASLTACQNLEHQEDLREGDVIPLLRDTLEALENISLS